MKTAEAARLMSRSSVMLSSKAGDEQADRSGNSRFTDVPDPFLLCTSSFPAKDFTTWATRLSPYHSVRVVPQTKIWTATHKTRSSNESVFLLEWLEEILGLKRFRHANPSVFDLTCGQYVPQRHLDQDAL